MKRPALSNIVYAVVALLFAAGAFYVIYFPIKERENASVAGIRVEFRRGGHNIVKESEVLKRIEMTDKSFSGMENAVRTIQGVKEADVYSTPDGYMTVSILERVPFLRIQSGDYSWWVDEQGSAFPIQGDSYKDIPSIGGCAIFASNPKWIKETIGMVKEINKNRKWSGKFNRITVDSKGEYVLWPEDGKINVIFGGVTEVDRKLNRLDRFYEQILPSVGDSTYRSVNVKYKGQVICRK